MTVEISALDVPLAQVESAVRHIASQQLLGEQAHDLDDYSVWCAQHPLAQTPATDQTYPGWAEHIAAIERLNEKKRKEAGR